jgi:hypothetical protein
MSVSLVFEDFIRVGDCSGFLAHLNRKYSEELKTLRKNQIHDGMFVAAELDQMGMLKWMIEEFKEMVSFEAVSWLILINAAEKNEIEKIRVIVDELGAKISGFCLDFVIENNLWEIFALFLDDDRLSKIDQDDGNNAILVGIVHERWRMVERLKEVGFVQPRKRTWMTHLNPSAEYNDKTNIGPKCAGKLK